MDYNKDLANAAWFALGMFVVSLISCIFGLIFGGILNLFFVGIAVSMLLAFIGLNNHSKWGIVIRNDIVYNIVCI